MRDDVSSVISAAHRNLGPFIEQRFAHRIAWLYALGTAGGAGG